MNNKKRILYYSAVAVLMMISAFAAETNTVTDKASDFDISEIENLGF
jgi:hypothetical protein